MTAKEVEKKKEKAKMDLDDYEDALNDIWFLRGKKNRTLLIFI